MRVLFSTLALTILTLLLPADPLHAECVDVPAVIDELRHLNVDVQLYEVHGTTYEELRRELRGRGPKDRDGGSRDAFFGWKLRWQWPVVNGRPLFSKLKITAEGTLIFPCLSSRSQLTNQLRQKWNKFSTALATHERMHAEHYLKGRTALELALKTAAAEDPSLGSKAANKIGNQQLQRIRELDLRLDETTDHGRKDGALF